MPGRGWTPNDEDPRWERDGYYDEVSAKCDGLASWWSRLRNEAEQEAFRRDDEQDDGGRFDYSPRSCFPRGPEGEAEYAAECAMIDGELREFNQARAAVREEREAQIDYIETKLAELGARMMRPYEHWNEDEALVAYQERDR